LRAGYDGAGGFDVGVWGGGGELFVEGEADGLDGDVGRAFAFEEGSRSGWARLEGRESRCEGELRASCESWRDRCCFYC